VRRKSPPLTLAATAFSRELEVVTRRTPWDGLPSKAQAREARLHTCRCRDAEGAVYGGATLSDLLLVSIHRLTTFVFWLFSSLASGSGENGLISTWISTVLVPGPGG
jgi:hypothetical protein